MTPKQKILIIEDEKILGEILLDKLISEGYDGFWALDGEDGLNKMRELKPDLVLLDIVMPKKDGYEVLEEVQKDETLSKIPIIIISNSGQPVELKRILELGAKDYIVKADFSPQEVLDKVHKYLVTDEPVQNDADKAKKAAIKIMVVEDDPFLASLTSRRMTKEGYTVLLATDGMQVMKMLETEVPDLILLDVIMPEMNGFDVLKKIKADPRFAKVIIIIFSNLGQEFEIDEAKNLGADEFFIKANFTPKEVVTKINEMLKAKGRI